MNSATKYLRTWNNRTNGQPFRGIINANVIINSPLVVFDSKAQPAQGSYSIQLNGVGTAHFYQAAAIAEAGSFNIFRVENPVPNATTVTAQDWQRDLALPNLDALKGSILLNLYLWDTETETRAGIDAIAIQGGARLFNGYVTFPSHEPMTLISLDIVGWGNCSVATFTAGQIDASIFAETGDLTWFGWQTQRPPPVNLPGMKSCEVSNLLQTVKLSSGYENSFLFEPQTSNIA